MKRELSASAAGTPTTPSTQEKPQGGMQLFTFGHPCEFQLRRSCIGGASCPLNGYPDAWCCSFVKGRINFKRDKPCEGSRCRWNFTHPTQALFDAVTLVLNDARAIAAKLEEGAQIPTTTENGATTTPAPPPSATPPTGGDLLNFSIETLHITDTVQCSLHMLHVSPGLVGRRVGQLITFAALRSGDAKVFSQLLRTMRKPIDAYLLGAYEYIMAQRAAIASSGTTVHDGLPVTPMRGKKKDDVTEELRNDVVEVMNSALSQGGTLVCRDEQRALQIIFLHALRGFPKNNKRRHDMAESATAKFGAAVAALSALPSGTVSSLITAAVGKSDAKAPASPPPLPASAATRTEVKDRAARPEAPAGGARVDAPPTKRPDALRCVDDSDDEGVARAAVPTTAAPAVPPPRTVQMSRTAPVRRGLSVFAALPTARKKYQPLRPPPAEALVCGGLFLASDLGSPIARLAPTSPLPLETILAPITVVGDVSNDWTF